MSLGRTSWCQESVAENLPHFMVDRKQRRGSVQGPGLTFKTTKPTSSSQALPSRVYTTSQNSITSLRPSIQLMNLWERFPIQTITNCKRITTDLLLKDTYLQNAKGKKKTPKSVLFILSGVSFNVFLNKKEDI
jgi:hypothetical protein